MIPWIHSLQFHTLLYIFLTTCIIVEALDLPDEQIDVVSLRLAESAQLSWELGTRAQTILERSATSYSVFARKPLPPPNYPDTATLSALQPLFDMANDIMSNYHAGPQPLMPDGSSGDPASLGVCVLIAHLTRDANGGASRGLDYLGAAKSQIDFLLDAVPRTSDGALSHRVEELQLWSDFVYMVPPFLAYYGVTTKNRSMVFEAYNQIKLYRNHLRDPAQGMWRHVVLGPSWNDPGFWSTGNGWAAAGILRVYATIVNSEYASSLQNELGELASWVHEIHAAMYYRLDKETNMFTNYADKPATSPGNFYDAASTALLASTVYRAAQYLGQKEYLTFAEKSREELSARNSTSPFSYSHFSGDGVLFPVVDPHSFDVQSTVISPEGQAFVVQMHQAWKDWKSESESTVGKSTGSGSSGSGSTVDGSTVDGSTGSGSTADGSTADGSTVDGSTTDGSNGGSTTVSGSNMSLSTEGGTPCSAVVGDVNGGRCNALIGINSGDRYTALIKSKSFVLVVFTIWGLVCTF